VSCEKSQFFLRDPLNMIGNMIGGKNITSLRKVKGMHQTTEEEGCPVCRGGSRIWVKRDRCHRCHRRRLSA